MNKVWLIFRNEYLRHVMRRRFILVVLSMPLFVLLLAGVGFLSAALTVDHTPIGLIDRAGVLPQELPQPEQTGLSFFRDPPLLSLPNEDAARQAVSSGQIKAYYVIEADYLQTGLVRMVAVDARAQGATQALAELLRNSLLAGQPDTIVNRLLTEPEVIITSPDRSRVARSGDWISMLLPILAGVLMMITINTSGGYLVQAVVEEKENRTMEIVITSVSPMQLMTGKILGNLSVGLTQLFIWIVFILIGLRVAQVFYPQLAQSQIDMASFLLMLVTMLPAFVMIAALMATVGATAAESREAQQVAGLFSLPIAVPFWFLSSIMSNPNGPIATGLSLFPLSAPVALPMRATFSIVPFWQIALSVGLLVLAAGGALWLAGKAFQLGMLRYGKTLTLRQIFHPGES